MQGDTVLKEFGRWEKTQYFFLVYNFFDIFASSQHKGIYKKQKATKRYMYVFREYTALHTAILNNVL